MLIGVKWVVGVLVVSVRLLMLVVCCATKTNAPIDFPYLIKLGRWSN